MNYYAVFYNTILFIVLISCLGITPSVKRNQVVDVPPFTLCFFVFAFIVWCLGSEPFYIGSWTDRGCYAQGVLDASRAHTFSLDGGYGEKAFSFYIYLSSFFVGPKGWFYLTAFFYVGNLLLTSRRLTGEYAYVMFISFLIAFQFYAYGTNTIRAGIATSLMLVGISFCNKIWLMSIYFFIALFCHKSMAVPLFALAIAYKFPKTKFFLLLWVVSIGLSFFIGSFLQSLVAGLTQDTRADYITTGDSQYRSMFRWDFLAYSALPVFLGWFYIFKLNFKSIFYRWVYNAYLISNTFWILVIRAAFSDRFAYLSWFMFPILLMYPLLSQQLYRECYTQSRNIILVLFGQIAFSYFMFWAYNGHKLY